MEFYGIRIRKLFYGFVVILVLAVGGQVASAQAVEREVFIPLVKVLSQADAQPADKTPIAPMIKVAVINIEKQVQQELSISKAVTRTFESLQTAANLSFQGAGIDTYIEKNAQIAFYSIRASTEEASVIKAIEWSITQGIKVLKMPTDHPYLSEEVLLVLGRAKAAGIVLIQKRLETQNRLDIESVILDLDQESLKVTSTDGSHDGATTATLVEGEGLKTEDAVLLLLGINPNLTHEQIYNVLTVSANPIGSIEKGIYQININRAMELLLIQMRSNQEMEPVSRSQSLRATVASTGVPSIVATNVTANSVTWQVSYPTPNAYGNRLELWHPGSGAWTNVSGTYNTSDGAYVSNNLQSDNAYMGRLTYLRDGTWIVVDTWVTTLTNTAELKVDTISSAFAQLKATFPNNSVYGNRLELCNKSTGQWIFVSDYYAVNGTYQVSNLTANTEYFARMLWRSGEEWKLIDVHFKTPESPGAYQYEYDSRGRVKTAKDLKNGQTLIYIYDENGNLISIKK